MNCYSVHCAVVPALAIRAVGDNKNYIRVNQFLMPFWTKYIGKPSIKTS